MSATSKPTPTGDVESLFSASLREVDPEIAEAIRLELGRQRDEIELIALSIPKLMIVGNRCNESALRWSDVAWPHSQTHLQRTFDQGRLSTPKTRTSQKKN